MTDQVDRSATAEHGRMVARCRRVPDLRALVRRRQRRRHRRHRRHAEPAGRTCATSASMRCGSIRGTVAAARRRLRRRRLPGDQRTVRHHRRRRDVHRRGRATRHPGARRPCARTTLVRARWFTEALVAARLRRHGPATTSSTAAATTASCHRTTGSRSSAVRRGRGSTTASGTSTCSTRASPTSTGAPRRRRRVRVRDAVLARPWCGRLPDRRRPRARQGAGLPRRRARPSTTARRRRAAAVPRSRRDPPDRAPLAAGARRVRRPDDGRRGVGAAERRPLYLRPDEYHQAFDFDLLSAPWDADEFERDHRRRASDAAHAVGSNPTWVLSNHDVVRHATRYGLPDRRRARTLAARRPARRCSTPSVARAGRGPRRWSRWPARVGVRLPGRRTRPARGVGPAASTCCRIRSGTTPATP